MKAQVDNDMDCLESELDSARRQLYEAQVGFKSEWARLNLELSTCRKDVDSAHEQLTTLQEHNQDLSQQLIPFKETACHFANDLFEAKGKLATRDERHAKFKVDYHDPIESLNRVHNLAITRER